MFPTQGIDGQGIVAGMSMSIQEVLIKKRWMRLAMPEDVEQCIWLAIALHPNETEHRQAIELEYLLNQLRKLQWDRTPSKPATRPKILRPSRASRARGYRRDHNVRAIHG